MRQFADYPFGIRLAVVLLAGYLLILALVYGSSTLIPFFLAVLLAFLSLPLLHRLRRWGLGEGAAAGLTILVVVVVFLAIVFGLGAGIASVTSNMDNIGQRVQGLLDDGLRWIEETFGVSAERVRENGREELGNFAKRAAGYLGSVATSLGSLLVLLVLIPFYIFTMLYYRHHWHRCLVWMASRSPEGRDADSARRAEHLASSLARMVRSYVTGVGIHIGGMTAMYALGLGLMGLPYWPVVAVVCGLLNLVPFVGAMIANVLPAILALALMNDPVMALVALGITLLAQGIDEYFITPRFVGGKVHLNPLTTLLTVFVGGMVWGPAGMILFIPLVAMLKIALDHYPSTQPYGALLGKPQESKPAEREAKAVAVQSEAVQ